MAEDTKASSKKHIPMLLLWTASTKHVKESLTVVLKYEIVWEIRASWHQFRKRGFSTAFENTEIEEYEKALSINYLSQIYACKTILPIINEGGAIVNVASASALCPFSI